MENNDNFRICDVVQKYLDATHLSLRDFANALMVGLSPSDRDTQLTHASIQYWKVGRTEPNTDLLVLLMLRNKDWKFDFALECLAAKRPEVWGPEGGIWQLAQRLHVAG